MKQLLKRIMIAVYHLLNVVLPKDRHLAVVSSGNGKGTGGNPRAVYDYAVRNCAGFRFVWFLTEEYMKKHPEDRNMFSTQTGKNRSKAVVYGHPAYYWYMARAGLWIFDSRQEPYIVKRPGVRYLQTWHGTPLKKLGIDLTDMNMAGESRSIEAYALAVKKEASMWDLLIAQNSFSHETFRRCFAYSGQILDIGYPRNDVLVRAAAGEKKSDIHTILYAPTWRDDRYTENGWYAYSSPLDLEELEKRLGEGFRIIIKPHYLVKLKKNDIPESVLKSGFVRIASGSEDIAGLYLEADAMITDYSSVMFDYSLLKRPMIFYAYDLDEYKNRLRGFYFDLEKEAPGMLCSTTEEVAEALKKAFDKSPETPDIEARIKAFRDRYNTYDDGNASRKAWEALVK
ncbi:MAG: CDP-glycerol glycerophosphotransferase family protein [Lachnospiraceae bacterium]|nr:CDP-glycerol glycerophosphotransferase family protein [Lachnospiraceae bacterium]